MSDLSALQRESAKVNEALGVIAFLVGVLTQIQMSQTVENARTYAVIARGTLIEWREGIWKPGPHDDPNDWNR